MYAIGGSANPTINSEGNRFIAPDDANAKEVTKRLYAADEEWNQWNWRSAGDLMLNGAYFVPSGAGAADNYALASSLGAKSAFLVGTITGEAGVLQGRTQSSGNGNNHMSVSAAPISILSASHSHRIIYFFICAVCLALTALDVLR
jgi:pectate lyase